MDITTLAVWGEFLGGVAVVASLIYLASQIRQNSRLLRTSTAAATSATTTAVNTLIVQDPEVARIYSAGIADRSAMGSLFSAEGERSAAPQIPSRRSLSPPSRCFPVAGCSCLSLRIVRAHRSDR